MQSPAGRVVTSWCTEFGAQSLMSRRYTNDCAPNSREASAPREAADQMPCRGQQSCDCERLESVAEEGRQCALRDGFAEVEAGEAHQPRQAGHVDDRRCQCDDAEHVYGSLVVSTLRTPSGDDRGGRVREDVAERRECPPRAAVRVDRG